MKQQRISSASPQMPEPVFVQAEEEAWEPLNLCQFTTSCRQIVAHKTLTCWGEPDRLRVGWGHVGG